MWQLVLQKLATIGFTLWLTLTVAFVALRLLPGNAIDAQLYGTGLPDSVVEARKATLGLDLPLWQQYINYIIGIPQGDWGHSLYTGQTVLEAISNRLPSTIALATNALILAVFLGVLLGYLSGIGQPIATLLIDLSLGIPVYVTATLLLFIIAARIGGMQRGLLLPVLALGFHTSGAIARLIATNYQKIASSEFVRTAHAKGLPQHLITRRHILRLTLLPAIPIIGLQAGIIFSGTVITESIFGRAGLGLLLLNATFERDYPIVQGVIVLSAITYIIFNALADLLTNILDPRLSQ